MFRGDERAVTVQIGAIILFAFLILGLTLNQAVLIPAENKQVEFESYQETEQDITSLRSDVVTTAGSSVETARTLETGTQYPPRALAINPPPATWQLAATQTENVTVSGARAAPGSSADFAAYWDGSDKAFETSRIRFTPSFNELDVEPLVLSGSLVYRDLGNGAQPITSQTLLTDRKLTIVTVTGDVEARGLSTELVVDPVSSSTERVSITGDGGNLNLTLPTDVPASTWGSDLLASNPHVVSVTDVAGGVRIELDGSQTYDLRLARVELRSSNTGTAATTPDPHYIVRDQGDNASITTNQSLGLVAEVRDRFNNPVSGVDVTFTEESGATTTLTTNDRGEATYTFTESSPSTQQVTATFDGGGLSRTETAFTVFVEEAAGGSNEQGLAAQDQFLDNGLATGVRLVGTSISDKKILLEFENTEGTDWTAVEARAIGYHTPNANFVTAYDYSGTTVEVGGSFATLDSPYSVDAGATTTVSITNIDGVSTPSTSHFLMLSVIYEDDEGTKQAGNYFISVS